MVSMKSREIAFKLFSESGLTNSEYARRLGLTRAAMWDRINTTKAKDMTVSVFADTVSALGYSVVVMKNPPEGAYIVD